MSYHNFEKLAAMTLWQRLRGSLGSAREKFRSLLPTSRRLPQTPNGAKMTTPSSSLRRSRAPGIHNDFNEINEKKRNMYKNIKKFQR